MDEAEKAATVLLSELKSRYREAVAVNIPMNLSRLATHIATLFFLVGSSSLVSGAGADDLAPANAPAIYASFEDGPRNDPEGTPVRGYGWKIPPPKDPDWKGVGRDTAYFVTYQALVVGVLYLAPESVSGWTKEDKAELKWRENVSNPHRDKDDFYINYLLHPYWGATYYIRGRERGLDRGQSFLFSAALSTLYEFGLEAFFEQPSYQDLWVTPVVGSLIGELVFTPIRDRIRAKPGDPDWTDKVILFFTDPLGVVGAQTDRLLGVQTTLRLQVFQPALSAQSSAHFGSSSYSPVHGAFRQAAPTWGVQLQVRW